MQCQICEVCLNSALLCPSCQNKLDFGKITEKEIDVLKYLHSLEENIKSLKDVRICKVIEGNTLTIVTNVGDAPRVVGKGGAVVKMISKNFGKNVRVLEAVGDLKDFVQNLVSPHPVSGINTRYSLSGQTYKVRIPNTPNTPIRPDEFSNIISSVYGLKAELVFE